jgi:hypothetical protein
MTILTRVMRSRAVLAVSMALTFLLTPLLGPPLSSGQMDKLMNTTPDERANAQTALMKAKLDLTADQLPKIAAINQKYAQKMEPIIKGSGGPFMKMSQMRGVNEEKEAELKQVLSPEQFQKYLASKEEMREQFEEKLEEKRGGGGY